MKIIVQWQGMVYKDQGNSRIWGLSFNWDAERKKIGQEN